MPALVLCSSGVLSLVQSRLSPLLPPDLSILCLSLPAPSVLPLAFCYVFCHPPPPNHPLPFRCPGRKKKKRGFFALPVRSTASETLLWFPRLLSMGLSPQLQITPMSHCLNVSEGWGIFFLLFFIVVGDGFRPAVSIKKKGQKKHNSGLRGSARTHLILRSDIRALVKDLCPLCHERNSSTSPRGLISLNNYG